LRLLECEERSGERARHPHVDYVFVMRPTLLEHIKPATVRSLVARFMVGGSRNQQPTR
jgi:hypothetical protein